MTSMIVSFFIPYIYPNYTKEELIDIIENTYQIGKVGEIDIVLSKRRNYMAFIHMTSINITDRTNKIFSIMREQKQYYLYDIKKRTKIILKEMIQKNKKREIHEKEKWMSEINTIINQKFVGIYTEIENIKHILYEMQRKLYGYSIPHVHIGNRSDHENNWT